MTNHTQSTNEYSYERLIIARHVPIIVPPRSISFMVNPISSFLGYNKNNNRLHTHLNCYTQLFKELNN